MEFQELILTRRSVRKYLDKPVEDEKLGRVLEAARVAPSACNNQPWHFIVIRDEEMRQRLSEAYGRDWFYTAPVIICACGEPSVNFRRIDGKNYNDVDVTIAMDHLILAAAEEGLGTCWIGAFKPDVARKVLEIPEGIEPVAMTPLGYPAEPLQRAAKKRKELKEIIHFEKW